MAHLRTRIDADGGRRVFYEGDGGGRDRGVPSIAVPLLGWWLTDSIRRDFARLRQPSPGDGEAR